MRGPEYDPAATVTRDVVPAGQYTAAEPHVSCVSQRWAWERLRSDGGADAIRVCDAPASGWWNQRGSSSRRRSCRSTTSSTASCRWSAPTRPRGTACASWTSRRCSSSPRRMRCTPRRCPPSCRWSWSMCDGRGCRRQIDSTLPDNTSPRTWCGRMARLRCGRGAGVGAVRSDGQRQPQRQRQRRTRWAVVGKVVDQCRGVVGIALGARELHRGALVRAAARVCGAAHEHAGGRENEEAARSAPPLHRDAPP